MVSFKKESFVIEVYAGTCPIEDWLGAYRGIISLLTAADPELRPNDNYYMVWSLLYAMMPDLETAKKMTE
jgi:hypothetical protein